MIPITALVPLISKAAEYVDEYFETDEEKTEARLQMAKLSKSLMQGQIDINLAEAKT